MIDRWDCRPWLARAGDALSQALNVWLLNGMPDESISGRSYRNTALRAARGLPVKRRWRVIRALAEGLFWWERGLHTELAYAEDVRRAGLRFFASRRNDDHIQPETRSWT